MNPLSPSRSSARAAHSLILIAAGLLTALPLAAATPAATAASASASAPAPVPTPPSAESLHPTLPISFADFAADMKSDHISPPWMTVEVGTLETLSAPPPDRTAFWFSEHDFAQEGELVANFHPTQMACLMGAKAHFENTTSITLDKMGNPLGYSLPMGQIIYFAARGTTAKGLALSLYYYDSGKSLSWFHNPEKNDLYIPITHPLIVAQDLEVPLNYYAFVLLPELTRVGPPREGSTAMPLRIYTYMVVHVRQVEAPAAPTGIVGAQ